MSSSSLCLIATICLCISHAISSFQLTGYTTSQKQLQLAPILFSAVQVQDSVNAGSILHSIEVESDHNGAPIDWFLAHVFPERSRRYFRKVIQKGDVKVNGKVTRRFAKLRSGQVIDLKFAPLPEETHNEAQDLNLVVLFEDDDIIVISKPAGHICYPVESEKDGTVLNGLLYHFLSSGQNIFGNRIETLSKGIVHRLDRDTSGVMIFAKNIKSAKKLSASFKSRKSQKKYLAICAGYAPDEQKIELPMYRTKSGKMAILTEPSKASQYDAKHSASMIKTLMHHKGLSLVELELLTGRMHQARVHMKYSKAPVLGDSTYGKAKTNKDAEHSLGIVRAMLHASVLKIEHPTTGDVLHFSAPLPNDMWNIAERYIARNEFELQSLVNNYL
mmetsp:Transcript_38274/g.50439  ORF Transcript_38274/g.50439 Transcript_38274/m.50439 type:complete len:388 (+) Transcript_38274:118-1281(+)